MNELEQAVEAYMGRGLQDDTVLSWELWNEVFGYYTFTGTYSEVMIRLNEDSIVYGNAGISIGGKEYETSRDY